MTGHVTRPTRRSVVRAAAWSAPALTVAAAAPAAAAGSPIAPYLEVVLNDASVDKTSTRYELFLRSAVLTPRGGIANGGTLFMAVWFTSNADQQRKGLTAYAGVPGGPWLGYATNQSTSQANFGLNQTRLQDETMQIMGVGNEALPLVRAPLNTLTLPGKLWIEFVARTPTPVTNFVPWVHSWDLA